MRKRDRAWPLGEYPCVGQWQWLRSILPTFKSYSIALERIINNDNVLDLGCCFGQELRQLAADGAPTNNMYASDLHSELWEIGYDLYRDRDTMKAQFIQADILDENSRLNDLTRKIDVFIICQLLHLFSWEDQIKACKTMVKMSKPGSIIIGYQLGQTDFQSHKTPWGMMCFHNAKTFRQMWGLVAEETNTSWDVEIEEAHLRDWGMEPEDSAWMGPTILALNFTITRGHEKEP
jgi:ubiquinone/menaquinone biosynthesis C-methylase UbiE